MTSTIIKTVKDTEVLKSILKWPVVEQAYEKVIARTEALSLMQALEKSLRHCDGHSSMQFAVRTANASPDSELKMRIGVTETVLTLNYGQHFSIFKCRDDDRPLFGYESQLA